MGRGTTVTGQAGAEPRSPVKNCVNPEGERSSPSDWMVSGLQRMRLTTQLENMRHTGLHKGSVHHPQTPLIATNHARVHFVSACQSLFFFPPSTLPWADQSAQCPALRTINMPIRPQPLTLRCPQCNWRMTWQSSSDALTRLPSSSCLQCGSEDLQVRQKTGLLADLATQLRRVIAG